MAIEIGFTQGKSVKPESWDITVGGVTFTFTKTREKSLFLYNCTCNHNSAAATQDSSTGFRTDSDLSREEIMARPQFRDFVEGNSRA